MCRDANLGGRRCPNQHLRPPRSRVDDALRQRASRYARRVAALRAVARLTPVIDAQLGGPTGADVIRELRAERRAARRAGDVAAYELLTVRIDAAQLADANRQLATLRWREGT